MEGQEKVDVSVMASDLARLVEVMMDPSVPQAQKLDAYTTCEQFKETSPLCAQCGFYLAQNKEVSHIVRHFGLQLMEHCVKYRWNQISQQEKLFIKENAMKLLMDGIDQQLQGYNHIKDALSRVIVEMIKREWPQQWPTLLKELSDACTHGGSQTEMVLFVFLRLVEDVALLQTLESNQRRKDLYQALTTNMGDIFTFFLKLIVEHCQEFKTLTDNGKMQEATSHARVVQVVLLTLTGFVEWVSISHIMADNGRLLQILCLLLDQDSFQNGAAECLLQIVNRKGRVEERKPLLILFSEDAMRCMFVAAGVASTKPLDEQHYMFLKKLTQVLTGLGTQLCVLWGKEDGANGRPPNFAIYLDAILTFTQHPSLTLAHYANSLWMAFFKHELISKDPVFLTFVPKWVQSTAPKIIKVGYPSYRNGPNADIAAYSSLDFDSDEEFSSFFHRCRTDMLDTFRQATLVAPLVTFGYVEEWLKIRIQKSKEEPEVECNINSPTFLEWEALSLVLESVLSRILVCLERPSVSSGLHLLELCLAYEPSDPLLLSALLSCISALFVFLSMGAPGEGAALLPRVLDKIFGALVFGVPGQTKDSRSRAVKNVRRHAASLMVKIGHKYPLLLLPVFERIHGTVEGLNNDPLQLSRLEKVLLQEALLLISNHFCEYERQTRFVGEIIAPGVEQWHTLGQEAFKGPKEFMAFVGLDRPPVEPSCDDVNGQNRSHILFCIHLFMAVVKRCMWPEDPDRAARGGFVVGYTEAGNPICRNPAAPHLIPLLPNLLMLIRVFNMLWTPEALALLSEGYRNAHAMLSVERSNLLGMSSPCPTASDSVLDRTAATSWQRSYTPLDRMQHFLSNVHDTCYHILGYAGPSMGRDFYSLRGLAGSLVASVFSNLEVIPDYRLRPMVRVFLKAFVHSCPPAFYDSALLPVLAHFCPYMFQRLNTKWQYITQLYETGGIDEDNTDTQEVLEDMLNRMLTREYLEVLRVALIGGTTETVMETMEHEEAEPTRTSSLQTEVISELGTLLLRTEATCQPIVLCILRALAWSDTISSLKATLLVLPVVRQLCSDNSLTPPAAMHVMTSVLQGLQMHGQHDSNHGALVTLGLQLYEVLRPRFPEILEVMTQIPNCNSQELQKLDDKIASGNQKAKKEVFKKITKQLIGRSVAQLFRKEVRIADLPRMELPPKPKMRDLLETEDVGLCKLFDVVD